MWLAVLANDQLLHRHGRVPLTTLSRSAVRRRLRFALPRPVRALLSRRDFYLATEDGRRVCIATPKGSASVDIPRGLVRMIEFAMARAIDIAGAGTKLVS